MVEVHLDLIEFGPERHVPCGVVQLEGSLGIGFLGRDCHRGRDKRKCDHG